MGSQMDAHMLGVIPLEIQYQPRIPKVEVLDVEVEEIDLWTTPIQEYIANGILPGNKDEPRKLRYKATQYGIYDGVLYKRGFNRPHLKCVAVVKCEYIMREVHEEICENHSGVLPLLTRYFVRATTSLPFIKMRTPLPRLVTAARGSPAPTKVQPYPSKF